MVLLFPLLAATPQVKPPVQRYEMTSHKKVSKMKKKDTLSSQHNPTASGSNYSQIQLP